MTPIFNPRELLGVQVGKAETAKALMNVTGRYKEQSEMKLGIRLAPEGVTIQAMEGRFTKLACPVLGGGLN